jgi:flagellar protein FlaJ
VAEKKLVYPAISKKFIPLGRFLSKLYPGLKINLMQAEMPYEPEEYLAILSLYAVLFFLVTVTASFSVLILTQNLVLETTILSFIVGLFVSVLAYWYFSVYPRFIVIQKTRQVEKFLLYSMRHFLIKIKSGIPIYESMVGIALGTYGPISEEFKKTIKQINSGMSEETAIEKLALRNPSFYFRRTVWQIANSIRAGTDFSPVLEGIVSTLAWEQRTSVRRFASELNTVALMYLMTTIIFPALLVTLLIVFGSFSGIVVPQSLFVLVILVVLAFQFFFLNFIKVRRPVFEE